MKFVRSDESYIDYLKKYIPSKLPQYPNKSEQIYYAYEYGLKRNIKKQLEALDSLLSRVRRKIYHYEKKVNELVAARNLEEAELFQDYLDDLRFQEQDILERKREEIIRAAKLAEKEKEEEIPAKTEQNEEILPENEEKEPAEVWVAMPQEAYADESDFIPGNPAPTGPKFIIRIDSKNSFYAGENKRSIFKDEAYVFDDEKLANKVNKKIGGRVIRL